MGNLCCCCCSWQGCLWGSVWAASCSMWFLSVCLGTIYSALWKGLLVVYLNYQSHLPKKKMNICWFQRLHIWKFPESLKYLPPPFFSYTAEVSDRMRLGFCNWFTKLVLEGAAHPCKWEAGPQRWTTSAISGHMGFLKQAATVFFCFVEMCSSSKKPLAECSHTFIAYRENW